jgi:hypothetical protein
MMYHLYLSVGVGYQHIRQHCLNPLREVGGAPHLRADLRGQRLPAQQ